MGNTRKAPSVLEIQLRVIGNCTSGNNLGQTMSRKPQSRYKVIKGIFTLDSPVLVCAGVVRFNFSDYDGSGSIVKY